MSLHRTVTVLGFTPPVVKDGAVNLGIITSAGEGLRISCTLSLWRSINSGVDAAGGESSPRGLKPGKRDRRAKLDPATYAAIEKAYDRWITRQTTATVIAAELRIGGGTLSHHFARIRAERAAAGKAPVLKPSGQL